MTTESKRQRARRVLLLFAVSLAAILYLDRVLHFAIPAMDRQ